jgi:hypothetical protein
MPGSRATRRDFRCVNAHTHAPIFGKLLIQFLVVVDNTNPTLEDRKELITLGRLYGAETIGYFFEVQVKQCLERNRAREGKARVPDVAIFATLKKLTRPSYAEGFTKLFYVRTGGDQNFEVSDWKGEESTNEHR